MLFGLLHIETKRTISSPVPQTSKMLINRLGKSVMGSLNVWNFKLSSNAVGYVGEIVYHTYSLLVFLTLRSTHCAHNNNHLKGWGDRWVRNPTPREKKSLFTSERACSLSTEGTSGSRDRIMQHVGHQPANKKLISRFSEKALSKKPGREC